MVEAGLRFATNRIARSRAWRTIPVVAQESCDPVTLRPMRLAITPTTISDPVLEVAE